MERLKRIIGDAPSELSKDEFALRLRKERGRAQKALDEFAQTPDVRGREKALKAQPKAAVKALNELGLSLEDLIEAQKELEEEDKDD